MKKLLFIFCAIMLFYSCAQEEMEIDINEQAKIMKDDPVSIEYFKVIASLTKIMNEGGLDKASFRKIMESQNYDYCNVEKSIFKGDVEMENFAKARCEFINSKKDFHKKYPFLKDLNKKDKTELFSHLVLQQDYDIEKIKRNYHKKNSIED